MGRSTGKTGQMKVPGSTGSRHSRVSVASDLFPVAEESGPQVSTSFSAEVPTNTIFPGTRQALVMLTCVIHMMV